jgi:hypothetical protein
LPGAIAVHIGAIRYWDFLESLIFNSSNKEPIKINTPARANATALKVDAHRCRLYLSGPKERRHYQ